MYVYLGLCHTNLNWKGSESIRKRTARLKLHIRSRHKPNGCLYDICWNSNGSNIFKRKWNTCIRMSGEIVSQKKWNIVCPQHNNLHIDRIVENGSQSVPSVNVRQVLSNTKSHNGHNVYTAFSFLIEMSNLLADRDVNKSDCISPWK